MNSLHVVVKIPMVGPQVLGEHKEMAAKRRRQSTRLENLGIPEEELLRQQQELFARLTLK